MRKAFKSQVMFDQQVVSRHTMPTAMMETYKTCDTPPPLDKLNPYRYATINRWSARHRLVEKRKQTKKEIPV